MTAGLVLAGSLHPAPSAAGAVTPVCGLGVLPLIAALLRRGLPLAPVTAFWVSSPVTDPGMLVVTAGILGVPLAVAKTLAAFGVGLLAGAVTATLPGFGGPGHRLMRVGRLAALGCEDAGGGMVREAWANARLVARWPPSSGRPCTSTATRRWRSSGAWSRWAWTWVRPRPC